ncbi:MAG: hypothetical protein H6974_08530 [Gammaproteobacteria bacterium]|nr:hypothetical protein [Gammaproteobacteria bacterium]
MNPISDRSRLSCWQDRWIVIAQYIIFSLFLFGIKLWLIGAYGNATPFWDQWDAEAALLYKPFLEGTLSWTDLLVPHNEHRIFTTRVLALGLLVINGTWNPILQMVVNSVIHVAAIVFLISRLIRVIGYQYLLVLLLFSLVLFGVPYAWENTLAGFQSQFYFVLFFSTACLWLTTIYPSLSFYWWGGVACAFLAFLSLASGIFALAASSLTGVVMYAVGVRRSNQQLIGIVFLLGLFTIGYLVTPSLAYHASLKAHSLTQFLGALLYSLSWPAQGKVFFLGILIYSPALFFIWKLLTNQQEFSDKIWFILALLIWCFGQVVSISYGRAALSSSPRYLDLFAIGLVVNLSALLSLSRVGFQRQFIYQWALAWVAIVIIGFSLSAGKVVHELNAKLKQGNEQEKNVRAYLCSGDVLNLKNKQRLSIPYPDADRLKIFLDDLTIRQILPSNIYRKNSQEPVGPDGEPFCDAGSLIRAYEVRMWSQEEQNISHFAQFDSIAMNSWNGTDYFKSSIPGYKIIGSFIDSDNDTGMITIKLRRGDHVLYRSGLRTNSQFFLINNGGEGKFLTNLPVSTDWSVLEFSNPALPDEFDITFIDGGTKWGEWSAIGLRN